MDDLLNKMGIDKQLWNSCFINNGVVYQPSYTLTVSDVEIDGDISEVFTYDILKTGRQMYEESLNPPPTPPDKNTIRLDQIEEAVGVLATQVAKNTLLQNQGGI